MGTKDFHRKKNDRKLGRLVQRSGVAFVLCLSAFNMNAINAQEGKDSEWVSYLSESVVESLALDSQFNDIVNSISNDGGSRQVGDGSSGYILNIDETTFEAISDLTAPLSSEEDIVPAAYTTSPSPERRESYISNPSPELLEGYITSPSPERRESYTTSPSPERYESYTTSPSPERRESYISASDVQLLALQEMEEEIEAQSQHLETLEDAIQIALEESRSQRALALKVDASKATVTAARSLRNPKLTNATSYTALANQPTIESDIKLGDVASQILPGSISEILKPYLSYLPSFQVGTPVCDQQYISSATSVTLPIYLGGRINALTRAAEALQQATQAGENVGEQVVKLEVSEAYFMILRARRLHEVTAEASQTAAAHLVDAERLLKMGLVTRNVVLAAQVAASDAKQAELQLANAVDMAEAAYNRALWRPLDAEVAIADVELADKSEESLDSLTSFALRSRPELKVLAQQTRALQEQEKIIRADALPQVAAIGSYVYFQNSSLRNNSNAAASVGMTWTPFDGGTNRARKTAAHQSALASLRMREETESAIRLQTRRAWLAEKEAYERVEVARVSVEQAEENLRVVTRAFQEGVMSHTETLDAATMRTAAKTAYENAKYDAIMAGQRLKFAIGNL